MSLATILMIVLICVGCVCALAGVALAGHYAYRLVKAARKAGVSSRNDLQVVMRKVRDLGPRVLETQRTYEAVAERLQSLSATATKLNYLRDELDRATGRLSHLKF